VVTFVELPPEAGDDDEALPPPRPRRNWTRRIRYLVALTALLGAVLVGDGRGIVRMVASPARAAAPAPVSAGYVAADSGHCPHIVECTVVGRVRESLWFNYTTLFIGTHPVGGDLWYERSTGTVFYQRLDAVGPGGQVITLVQQRLSGASTDSGPTVELRPGPRPPQSAVVTAQRGSWLLSASLYGPSGVRLPVTAAQRWVMTTPLPR
jgi:hypothetical protein